MNQCPLAPKCSLLTKNRGDPQYAPVDPRMYLGLKYKHPTSSGSRGTECKSCDLKNKLCSCVHSMLCIVISL